MAKIAYSADFRLRVVAIASVRGAPEAARQFNLDAETVKAWQTSLAYGADLDGRYRLAHDLALSELTVDIAEGKNRGLLSTRVGIMRDKMARYAKPVPVPSVDPAIDTVDAWNARVSTWLDTLDPDQRKQAVDLLHYGLADTLARRSNDPSLEPPFDASDATVAAGLDALLATVQAQLPNALALLADRAVLTAARDAQRRMATSWLSDPVADLLIDAERLLTEGVLDV